MADGFSRATGKTGVCIAQNGPGITNFVTGVAAAFWAHRSGHDFEIIFWIKLRMESLHCHFAAQWLWSLQRQGAWALDWAASKRWTSFPRFQRSPNTRIMSPPQKGDKCIVQLHAVHSCLPNCYGIVPNIPCSFAFIQDGWVHQPVLQLCPDGTWSSPAEHSQRYVLWRRPGQLLIFAPSSSPLTGFLALPVAQHSTLLSHTIGRLLVSN